MPNYANLDSINKYYESLAAPVNANIKQAENDYNTNAKILQDRYDTSLNTSKANRQAELDALRNNKETADAQAYRSLQRQLYTVPEAMSASGAQGGMVDSGIAYIKNRYLQGRNDRDVQLASNNADVGRRYDQADADLLLGYNTDNAQLGRDYQNALEGYRGQLAQYEQQAAADRAEWEYQQALAAAQAAAAGGGGGGGRSTRRSSYKGGNGSSGDTTSALTTPKDTSSVLDNKVNGTEFSSNYGNYNPLKTTASTILDKTTANLKAGLQKANTNQLAAQGKITKNISSRAQTTTMPTTTKKVNSNLASLNQYK